MEENDQQKEGCLKKVEIVYMGKWGERNGRIAEIFLEALGYSLPKK